MRISVVVILFTVAAQHFVGFVRLARFNFCFLPVAAFGSIFARRHKSQTSATYFSSDRKLIFQGSGGPVPTLSLLSANDVLVRYCGGRVEKVETSFFETLTMLAGPEATCASCGCSQLRPPV